MECGDETPPWEHQINIKWDAAQFKSGMLYQDTSREFIGEFQPDHLGQGSSNLTALRLVDFNSQNSSSSHVSVVPNQGQSQNMLQASMEEIAPYFTLSSLDCELLFGCCD
uniref:Uncharacterized protein n=1 Tax=Micrurus paraensis TaxID=1970185 RepID=A0A2D4KLQ8_9SAUR